MATSGVLKIVGEDDEGKSSEVYMYRCCDAFADKMMELIQRAFDGIQQTSDPVCDLTPYELAGSLYAEVYIEAKGELSPHIYLQFWEKDEPHFTLEILNKDEWKLTYRDTDKNDNDIMITKIITTNGWEDIIINPSRRKQKNDSN